MLQVGLTCWENLGKERIPPNQGHHCRHASVGMACIRQMNSTSWNMSRMGKHSWSARWQLIEPQLVGSSAIPSRHVFRPRHCSHGSFNMCVMLPLLFKEDWRNVDDVAGKFVLLFAILRRRTCGKCNISRGSEEAIPVPSGSWSFSFFCWVWVLFWFCFWRDYSPGVILNIEVRQGCIFLVGSQWVNF